MDVRSILVHLDVTPASLERHALAHALAARFGAEVTVLFGVAEAAPPTFAYSAAAAWRAAEEMSEGPFDIARARPFTADPKLFAAPLVRNREGEWVLLHAGFAIQKLSGDDVSETWAVLDDLRAAGGGEK